MPRGIHKNRKVKTELDMILASNITYQKNRYKAQLKRLKKGLSPVSNIFNSDDMHVSIREILGEELSQKFIKEAHSYIKETKNHAKRNIHSQEEKGC